MSLFALNEKEIKGHVKTLFSLGDFAELDKACDNYLADKSISVSLRMVLMHYKSMANHALGNYEEELSILNDLIETEKPDSLFYWNIRGYIGMNDIFGDIGSLHLGKEALEIAEGQMGKMSKVDSVRFRDTYSQLYLAKAKLELEYNDISEALKQWRKAEPYSVSPSLRLTWLGMGGSIYEKKGETDVAEEYFMKVLECEEKNPNKAVALVHIMGYRNDRRQWKESLELLATYQDEAALGVSPYVLKYLLLAEGDALAGLGETEQAFENFKQAVILGDSIKENDDRMRNAFIAKRIDPSKYSALNNELSHAKSNWFISLLVLALVVLLLIVVVLLFYRHRNRSLKEIGNYKNSLRDSSLQYNQEREQWKKEHELAGRQLNATNLEVTRLYECLAEIRTETSRKDKNELVSIPIIKSILHRAQTVRNERETFNHRLEAPATELTEKLSLLHPSLTRAELEMCYYIFEGMSAKEVAMMTGRSIRTVETLKYKMRKKMGITESTEPYIRRIASTPREDILASLNN